MIGTIAAVARILAELRLVRAEESWIPVLFGGMIPIVGALGVLWLIRWAVKEPPEEEEPEDESPPPGLDDDHHEGPLS